VVTYNQRAGAGAGPHTHDWCGRPDVSHIGLAVDTGDSGWCRCCSSSICFTGSVLYYVYQEFASLRPPFALDLFILLFVTYWSLKDPKRWWHVTFGCLIYWLVLVLCWAECKTCDEPYSVRNSKRLWVMWCNRGISRDWAGLEGRWSGCWTPDLAYRGQYVRALT